MDPYSTLRILVRPATGKIPAASLPHRRIIYRHKGNAALTQQTGIPSSALLLKGQIDLSSDPSIARGGSVAAGR